MLIARSSVGGGISNGTDSASLLSVSLKCCAHFAVWSSSLEMVLLFLFLTGQLGLLFFPVREVPRDLIWSFHVSLVHCVLCFLGQLLNEACLFLRFFSLPGFCPGNVLAIPASLLELVFG